jgi:ceramide glucosyltransferase
MYIALNTLAIDSCVMGKSNLYRRSDVAQLDASLKPHAEAPPREDRQRGLKAFGKFMAEDNMIASALWHELGLRHDLSCDVAINVIGDMSLSDYIQRRVRWIRVRKHMILSATILEPLTESVLVGALASASASSLFRFPAWLFLVVHFWLWLTVDLDVYASLAGHHPPPQSRTQFVVAWAVRELLAFPIWLFAVTGSIVVWRGKRYHMLRNGEVRLAQGTDGFMSKFLIWIGVRNAKDMANYEPLDLVQD